MAKKSFLADLDRNQEQKKDVNLQTENQRLKDKLKEYENKQDVSGSAKIPLSKIKLGSNIRMIDPELDDIESLANDIAKLGQLQPVLLSNDNYLIAGHRRYYALKFLQEKSSSAHDFIYVFKLDKDYSDIPEDLINNIQFSENEQRRSLDNFQISSFFNKLLSTGKSQKEICETFNKNKGYVSGLINLKNMDTYMVDLIKEFQIYAWSKKKFIAINSMENINENSFYQGNRGIIGWSSLYSIAKHEKPEDQKQAFLKLFRNRLSEEELNSEYFTQPVKTSKKNNQVKFKALIKNIKSFSGMFSEVKENIPKEEFNEVEKYLLKVEKILVKHLKKA
jgi:hypothetical protein